LVQRIEIQNPPEEVFRSIVESAADICDSGGGSEDLVNELCGEDLARVSILPCAIVLSYAL